MSFLFISSSIRLADWHFLELVQLYLIRVASASQLFHFGNLHGLLLLDTFGQIVLLNAPMLQLPLLSLHYGMLLTHLVISIILYALLIDPVFLFHLILHLTLLHLLYQVLFESLVVILALE